MFGKALDGFGSEPTVLLANRVFSQRYQWDCPTNWLNLWFYRVLAMSEVKHYIDRSIELQLTVSVTCYY